MLGWLRSRKAAALVFALALMLGLPDGVDAQVAELMVGSNMGNGKLVSMDVQNAEIGTVLRSLASYSGVNIVASPTVTGKVTVKLDGVPWLEALTVILNAHGFDYIEEHGVIRVDTTDNLRKDDVDEKRTAKQVEDLEPLVVGMATLSFASAEEIKDSLLNMLTTRGELDVDIRTNTLLINDIPSRVELIEQIAHQLDSETPQVEINAKLVDMDRRASRELGIVWSAENIKDVGTNVVGGASLTAPLQQPLGEIRIGTVQSYGELMFNLQAMETQNLAHIISNPVITTTDNREASILVGQKIPLIVADEAGNAIVQLTTIGIVLRVTPHINSDNLLTLDVHNEVSDLSSQATVQGGVIINTSESDNRVLVRNGETAVIAGLIRTVESKLESGVPVLKDIPLLGALFRQETTVQNNRELVVFVTPRIVTNEYLTRDLLSADSDMVSGGEPVEDN
ncbi:MAG: secretin N-terminal domain-containing protein [bacterium]